MPLPGPILIISDRPDRKVAAALAGAGASSVVESGLADAAATVARVKPVAILLAGPDPVPQRLFADRLLDAIDALPAPFVPVMMRVKACGANGLDALPIDFNAPAPQIVARLTAMLRVRALHGTVLQRIDALRGKLSDNKGGARTGAGVPPLPDTDPLDEATVLVMGRGRHYPPLMAAAGARAGVIGALGVETAAHYLNIRDIDGIIIGEGFGPATLEAFLTALSEDSRFGDLPVGIVPDLPEEIDRARLAGIEPVRGTEADIMDHMMPMVRVHAFEARLRRYAASLDAAGMIDPLTGLFTAAAFTHGLPQVIADCRRRNVPMSIVRFDLLTALSPRARADTARLVRRLIAATDFASQDADGVITVAMSGTALHQCHVSARRIASLLRNAMLDERGSASPAEAMVTIAALRATDSPHSLLARVSEPASAAAE
jgi:hypothetical protein